VFVELPYSLNPDPGAQRGRSHYNRTPC
jgi:hypothetical protein